MKKSIKVFIVLVSVMALFKLPMSNTSIVTKNKEYNSANDTNVSTRELAILASLVYEDVPDDSKYIGKTAGLGCYNGTEKLKSDCFYTALEDSTASNLKLKKSSMYHIWQYIEGFSVRKINSVVGRLTSAFVEPGQSYYFLTFTDTTEMADAGWVIDNFKAVSKNNRDTTNYVDFDNQFYAVTFKKGDNYVIAYRGTDYPDLLEWLSDVGYAFTGEHNQAQFAYEYAQEEYKRISSNSNSKIYVTGHSLGAYLAQIGGAAIVDYEAGITDSHREPASYTTLDEYKNAYKNVKGSTSRLQQVAYFNGMGVNAMFLSKNFSKNILNSLVYLSTYDINGNQAVGTRKVNYSDKTSSSGRLVLYSMDADPVSDIGIHIGEIYKLDVAADAISNHHNNHISVMGTVLEKLLKKVSSANPDKVLTAIKNNWEKLREELNKEYNNKFTDSVSENIYSLISANSKVKDSSNTDYLPKFVLNKISETNDGKDASNYSLLSLVNNLSKDVDTFSNKYENIKIYNLFDHFNMNHETDSFTCLVDNANGKIEDVDVSIEIRSNSMLCEDKTCYTNKPYNVSNYKLDEAVSNVSGNNIIIKAQVEGACAKGYTWYYSTDNKEFKELGETIRNEIIIPADKLNVTRNNKKTIYFKVGINYGDNYKETKLRIGDTLYEYKEGTNYSTNPTINDGISKSSGRYVSKSFPVTLVYDTIAPACTFIDTDGKPISTKSIKLNTGFLGIANETEASINFKCTDDLSGLNSNSSDRDKFEMKGNSGIGLPIAKLGDKDFNKYGSDNTKYITIPVVALRKPLWSNKYAELKYKGGYADKAGNYTLKTSSVKIYTTK